ncbi:hypothetical protein K8Q94_03290 [Candidatus Nomurabacteria bacterium]|nr:hypothetical protein [Candidatus Nomurabacteria bacterium]
MAKCIYCLKDETKTTFQSREHVLPEFLGLYDPQTPVLRDCVCDLCNSIFSKLETKFREDTFEGILGQRLNFQNQNSITVRNKNFKITPLSKFRNQLFMRTFFLLKIENEKLVPDLRGHVTLKMKNGGYRVFLLESLSTLKKESSKFNKIKKDITKLSKEDIWIFVSKKEASIEQVKDILKNYGVTYNEKERGSGDDISETVEIAENYDGTVDKDIVRVIAKICFNYLCYCAREDNQPNILFHENFDSIRRFIYKGEGRPQSFFSIDENRILGEESGSNKNYLGHSICFGEENGKLYFRITLFGFQPYKLFLGDIPPELKHQLFGCAHIFDPLGKKIHNIAQNRQPIALDALMLSFGLLKRFR